MSATHLRLCVRSDARAHNVGDVLFVVQGYQQAAGGPTNVYLWINPDSLELWLKHAALANSSPPLPALPR